ncbi:MAG: 23S rRNA (pseudouridine(1915)-N(3))-methyltransferase RlmH [Lachnospiraceae bacterium]|nr:23S rRNA (pseudouridine(1915)-N(3))-methyltransferase RlmH [Lachnospiraceae bacterium]
MKIKIVCVGKIKENFYKEAIAEYSKRLSKFSSFSVIEVLDEKTDEKASQKENDLVLSKEGKRILEQIGNDDYVISLCIEGKQFSSVELSQKLSKIMLNGYSSIAFIIGGSLGLSGEVKERSDIKLSFSKMTFPHQLMRVILSEQIYRAFKIINNEPYHK